MDCGETVSGGYKATGLDYDTIDRIFISHLHSDHIGGFFMLMQGFWLEQTAERTAGLHAGGGDQTFPANAERGVYLSGIAAIPAAFRGVAGGQAGD